MTTVTLPLSGNITSRSQTSGLTKDQYLQGAFPKPVKNAVTGSTTAYVEKRGGIVTSFTPAAGNLGTAILFSPSTALTITAFGSTTSTIYVGTTNAGSLTTNYIARHITEAVFSGITYWLISAVDRTATANTEGWFLASNAYATTAYTGDTTSGSAVVTDVQPNTTGMYAGQAVSGTGITAGTRIQSVDSSSQITLTANATANGNDVAITKTPVAKIIDADFPSSIVGAFHELDGYIFIGTQNGRIYNSDVNSVTAWGAASWIAANAATDPGVGAVRVGDKIVLFGTNSMEWFYNAGNSSGSVLSRLRRSFPIGASVGTVSPYFRSAIATGLVTAWVWQTGFSSQVWMMDGETPRKISTPPIEVLLYGQTVRGISVITSQGETFVHIGFEQVGGSTKYNLLYGLGTETWTDAGWSDAMILSNAPASLSAASGGTYAIEAEATNGRVYTTFEPATFTDAGSAYTMTIQLGPINHGAEGKYKTINSVSLLADTEGSGTATLSYSDNQGASFITAGTFDMTSNDKRISGGGSYIGGRIWRLQHSAATGFRGWGLEIDYSVGA